MRREKEGEEKGKGKRGTGGERRYAPYVAKSRLRHCMLASAAFTVQIDSSQRTKIREEIRNHRRTERMSRGQRRAASEQTVTSTMTSTTTSNGVLEPPVTVPDYGEFLNHSSEPLQFQLIRQRWSYLSQKNNVFVHTQVQFYECKYSVLQ